METTGLIQKVLIRFPAVQALYLFGSSVNGGEHSRSDVDVAILLAPEEAAQAGSMVLSDLRFDLEDELGKTVDLINLRAASTVFQKEIVIKGKRIYTGDGHAAEDFETLTISLYQKLNEERREILDEFRKTGRAYEI